MLGQPSFSIAGASGRQCMPGFEVPVQDAAYLYRELAIECTT
jgi:hypothetical protein